MGSITPVREPLLKGSAPSTIKCLSVSLVMTCSALVGTLLAPERLDNSTALVVTPSFSTHRKSPPLRGLIIKFSPKLSCVHKRKLLVSDKVVADPQVPAPQVSTPHPVEFT